MRIRGHKIGTILKNKEYQWLLLIFGLPVFLILASILQKDTKGFTPDFQNLSSQLKDFFHHQEKPILFEDSRDLEETLLFREKNGRLSGFFCILTPGKYNNHGQVIYTHCFAQRESDKYLFAYNFIVIGLYKTNKNKFSFSLNSLRECSLLKECQREFCNANGYYSSIYLSEGVGDVLKENMTRTMNCGFWS